MNGRRNALRVILPGGHANIRAAMRRLFCLLLLLCSSAHAGDELSQRQAELQALKQRILSISQQADRDQARKDTLTEELKQTEQRLQRLNRALRTVKRDLTQAQQNLSRLQDELATLSKQLEHDRQQLRQQVRRRFMLGRQAHARMLLSQDDPARLARLQVYLEYLQQQQQRDISSALSSLEALQQKRSEADAALSTLKTLEQSRRDTLAAVAQQRAQRSATLSAVEERLREKGLSITRLREQQESLEKLIGALQKAAQRHRFEPLTGAFGKLRGKLFRPVDGKQLASFRQRKPDGQNRWNGIWLAADDGSPVHAVADARVVYVGWMHHFGLLVVLDHGDGYFSLYGHNRTALVQVGDAVKGGTPIAEAGNTGGHTDFGVYLEIRKEREPLNPGRWLRPRSS